MPHPKVKLSDDSGNVVGITSNRLDVNAYLSATPTIDIGDVSLLLGGTAASTNTGAVGAQTLRVTMAADDVLMGAINTNIADCEALLATIDADTANLAYLGYLTRGTGSAFSVSNFGINALAVRNDTLEATTGITDGEYSPLQTDSIGGLYVTGSEIENAAVQSEPLLIGGRYDSSARTLGSGDAGAVALNASGHVIVQIDGAALTALQKIDNPAAILGTAAYIEGTTYGAIAGAVRNDTLAALAGTDNEIAPFQVNADGALYVEVASSATLTVNSHAVTNAGTFAVQSTLQAGSAAIGKLTANSGVDIGDVDVTSISAGTNIIGKVGHDITGGADGVKTVSSAGTDVVLGGDVDCKKIDIQAQTDNTGLIAVGFTGVDATEATGTGVILYAGDTYSLEMVNLNLIYIDSTVSGDGVRYTYFT